MFKNIGCRIVRFGIHAAGFSTDFEVHRNWLAITHSLPFRNWYYENTSEWTLDYPPFFAWFEKFLSFFAQFFDPEMLVVKNLNYASPQTVLFQRLTVVISDFVFIFAVKEYCTVCLRKIAKPKDATLSPSMSLAVLLMGNAGLLMVDHIHFQYNGFLYGILLLSLNKLAQGKYLKTALLFAVLLNFKHIYLYMAPAFFIYLLRNYCFTDNKDRSVHWSNFSVLRLLILGVLVINVFLASFGLFLVTGQLPQVLSRLFPFKRGLCHAYWAPNFWALYNIADKILTTIGTKLHYLSPDTLESASMTGGLVQEFHHTVLPTVTPFATLCCTLMAVMPTVAHTWHYVQGTRGFLRCLTLCAWGAFMFGWHVHEKAILMVIIPLTLLAFEKKKDAQIFLFMSTVGHFSLFPLLFTAPEIPTKYGIVLIYSLIAFTCLKHVHEPTSSSYCLPLLSKLETLYIIGLVALEIYGSIIHKLLGLDTKLPFLPLLLTSVYCSVGMLYSWLKFYWHTLTDRTVTRGGKVD